MPNDYEPVSACFHDDPEFVNCEMPVCANVAGDPMNLKGAGAMDVTKSYKFVWFGDIDGPSPYEVIVSRATIISHTPVAQPSQRSDPATTRLPVNK